MKMWYMCIMEYYLTIKKYEIFPFATTWIELESTVLSDRERQIPYDFTYMWNLKNKINEQTKQKQTYR